MSIRRKILLYFSVITTFLIGVAFIAIYMLFAEYREEEFQQRQKEKIMQTLRFLAEIERSEEEFIKVFEDFNINDFYDEKLLLFNKEKELLYESIDDTPISNPLRLLEVLSAEKPWVEEKDRLYDVVAVYIEKENKAFYGISKAYDTFGYSKLRYLGNILSAIFLGICVIVVLVSVYLSKRITQPISDISSRINIYNFDEPYIPIEINQPKNEIAILAQQFNKLMKRMNEVFAFQTHAIHHISHELKTPIAILVSNFERIEKETDFEKVRLLLKDQKEDTKSLSEIINSLLEIAKAETGNTVFNDKIRVDELIFDIVEELSILYTDFQFSVEYLQENNEEKDLVIMANHRLLKSALMNLMLNCVQYSNDLKAKVSIASLDGFLQIEFYNKGLTINERERQFIFQHFFRGKNSKGKKGFGLGLVLIHKILTLHKGKVYYKSEDDNSNTFIIRLPLS